MGINEDMYFIEMAADLAREGVAQNEGGPFGCVIVKDGHVIGRGNNKVISTHDPTAHAEIVAIRDACRHLNSHQLKAVRSIRPANLVPCAWVQSIGQGPTALSMLAPVKMQLPLILMMILSIRKFSAPIDQRKIPTDQCGRELGLEVFRLWSEKNDKIGY